MKRLTATSDLGSFSIDGVHQKRRVRADDCEIYVIKAYEANSEGNKSKAPANEMLSYALARYLRVPIPPCADIDIGPDFAWIEDPGLFGAQRYFGSRFSDLIFGRKGFISD
jgi:hypothetical protein